MKRPSPALLLFAAAFCLTLLLHLPLRWVVVMLPKGMTCEHPDGSLWAGHCTNLSWRGGAQGVTAVGEVTWTLRPLQLLRMHLVLDTTIQHGALRATGLLQLGMGRIEALNLTAHGPLDPRLITGVPAGWGGELEVTDARVRLERGRLTAFDGDFVVRNLRTQAPDPRRWGSYRLKVPKREGSVPAPGELQDIEGPLRVAGTLTLMPDLSWQLDAGIATRAGADAELARKIESLGPANAEGLHPLAVAGGL